jgi:hypothetical protein
MEESRQASVKFLTWNSGRVPGPRAETVAGVLKAIQRRTRKGISETADITAAIR